MDGVKRHVLNLEAETEFELQRERDKEMYEVTIGGDDEEGPIITYMDYNKKPAYPIEGLESNPKGIFKKPYKGRKPGER